MYAFVDTNSLLHYPLPDQHDWLALTKSKEVAIVIAPVVIRELNRHKDKPETRKLRDRAVTVLKWLDRYIDEPSAALRPGMKLLLLPFEPTLDFTAHRLSHELNDDWLIASVLSFKTENRNAEVVLVTEDRGLRVKARAHDIPTYQLADGSRLPDQLDPGEKRLKELEAELLRYRSAMPKLSLAFSGGGDHLRVTLPKLPELSTQIAAQQLEEKKRQYPKLVKPSGYSGADLAIAVVLTPSEIDEYNKQLEDFYIAYKNYLVELHRFETRKTNTAKLEISLINSGNAPAEDIDVYMHFPDGMEVYDERGFEEATIEPSAPHKPLTRFEQIAADLSAMRNAIELPSMLGSSFAGLGRGQKTVWSNVSRWSIESKDSIEVQAHVKTLKHKLPAPLDELFIVFPSRDAVKSFTIEYTLLAANIPEEVDGRIHVIFIDA
jgi:rRNA-processing protein FCF1